jgi:hypothetical protein
MENLNWDISEISDELINDNEIEENINNIINNNNNNNNNIIINKNINNNSSWDLLIKELGLYNINYPLKVIQNGIFEIHLIKTGTSYSRYSRNFKFKNDVISKKIETIIFNDSFSVYSHMQIYRALARMYRHHKYNSIVNIVDRKVDKSNSIGFNYENPRWNTLNSEWIS